MPAGIALMQKGAFFRRLDDISRVPIRRDAFLAALKDDTQDYVQVLVAHGIVVDDGHADHLRLHWFPADPTSQDTWWKEHQPIMPVMRQGYARAFEEAQVRNLPIDGYWLSGGDRVAVSITWDDRKITLIRLTPPCPGYDSRPTAHTEPFIAVQPAGENIVIVQSERYK